MSTPPRPPSNSDPDSIRAEIELLTKRVAAAKQRRPGLLGSAGGIVSSPGTPEEMEQLEAEIAGKQWLLDHWQSELAPQWSAWRDHLRTEHGITRQRIADFTLQMAEALENDAGIVNLAKGFCDSWRQLGQLTKEHNGAVRMVGGEKLPTPTPRWPWGAPMHAGDLLNHRDVAAKLFQFHGAFGRWDRLPPRVTPDPNARGRRVVTGYDRPA